LEPRIELALGEQTALESRIESLIADHHAHRYLAFSQSLSPGFPVVDEAGVAWASRFDSMWALRGALWRARNGEREPLWLLRRWIVADFIRSCPQLVIVDDRDGLNYIRVLSASEEFASAWSRYREIAAFEGIRAFGLSEEGAGAELKARTPARGESSPCLRATTDSLNSGKRAER
jgi:hypothetical protein